MKGVFSFILTILLTVSVFRVLNEQPFMGVDSMIKTFTTYEFSFDKTSNHINNVKSEFDKAKATWDSVNASVQLSFNWSEVFKRGLLYSITKTTLQYTIALYGYVKAVFVALGTVIMIAVDFVENMYNLFMLAINMLGFNVPTATP